MRISDWSSDVCSSDLGDGVKRVRPAYKSGYAIEVGSAAFVSAIGTLKGADGTPVKLASGVIRRVDAPNSQGEAFFTNTGGRFAVAKLEPGVEYSVEFYTDGRSGFTFKVPEDNKGLLDLGKIGRASGRVRVCQYVVIAVGGVSLKKKKKKN